MDYEDAGGQETVPDVSWFNAKPTNSSQANSVPTNDETDRAAPAPASEHAPRVPFDKLSMYYDMTGEKIMIIFNHYKYQETTYFGNKAPTVRKGTDNDVAKLKSTFERRGFKVVPYTDLTHSAILDVMSKECTKDHKNTSCIAVVILTHGEKDEVYAADRPYLLSDVINPLQNGDPSLVGKPKLVFVQACRGGHMDDGRRVQTDGKQNIILPTHADTLILRSSSQHYLSYRTVYPVGSRDYSLSGSWLIQTLCQVIEEYHELYDLNSMITFVNQTVAYMTTYTPKNPKTNNKKQMPETHHSLTKFVKL